MVCKNAHLNKLINKILLLHSCCYKTFDKWHVSLKPLVIRTSFLEPQDILNTPTLLESRTNCETNRDGQSSCHD